MSKILVRETETLGERTFTGTIRENAAVIQHPSNDHKRMMNMMVYELDLGDDRRISICECRKTYEKADLKAQYYTAGKKVTVTGTVVSHWYPELCEGYYVCYGYGVLVR